MVLASCHGGEDGAHHGVELVQHLRRAEAQGCSSEVHGLGIPFTISVEFRLSRMVRAPVEFNDKTVSDQQIDAPDAGQLNLTLGVNAEHGEPAPHHGLEAAAGARSTPGHHLMESPRQPDSKRGQLFVGDQPQGQARLDRARASLIVICAEQKVAQRRQWLVEAEARRRATAVHDRSVVAVAMLQRVTLVEQHDAFARCVSQPHLSLCQCRCARERAPVCCGMQLRRPTAGCA